MRRSPTIDVCIAVKRTGEDCYMENDRDFWYHDLMSMPIASPRCETEQTDAEDPLFILYTSGTTGKPKGLVHTHGGYSVYAASTFKYVFDIQPDDRWWCAADPGWITGHSYIVYGPLINGATTLLYDSHTVTAIFLSCACKFLLLFSSRCLWAVSYTHLTLPTTPYV